MQPEGAEGKAKQFLDEEVVTFFPFLPRAWKKGEWKRKMLQKQARASSLQLV